MQRFAFPGLSTCVSMLEAEMAVLRQEIEDLNGHIATLLSTIRSLRRGISSLQDAAFGAKRDNLNPEFGGGQEAEGTEEGRDGNPMLPMTVPLPRTMLPRVPTIWR
ncbi:hypothetical protein RHMOL_Rhmol05G0147700 [Rhododendron molle]|uniref:Uncharacterized protein n=1 Tax=Rhododendron molle TaxID=49168 RepID=A0ACC0NP83_RHOML|nr:hypothetical protein RHMOL_Rhmol05G0147700 [Rhododendron molle]